MLLSREQIQAAADRATRKVPIPEWGGEVLVQSMDGPTRAEYEQFVFSSSSRKEQWRAIVAVFTVVNEDGQRIFTTDDVGWLTLKNAAAVDRVFTTAMKLNRLRTKDLEEIEGNCDGSQGGSSTAG